MISAWPTDDTLPAEGFDAVKQTYKKLSHGLHEIADTAAGEEKCVPFLRPATPTSHSDDYRALDDAIERVEVLIALRKAPAEMQGKTGRHL
jgi:SAGA-associated factor 29